MKLCAVPSRQALQIGFDYDVEIVEIAGATALSARHIAHHLAGITDLEQQRSMLLVDLAGRMGMAVRVQPRRLGRRIDRPVGRRGPGESERGGRQQAQKLTMKASRMRSSQSDGVRRPA